MLQLLVKPVGWSPSDRAEVGRVRPVGPFFFAVGRRRRCLPHVNVYPRSSSNKSVAMDHRRDNLERNFSRCNIKRLPWYISISQHKTRVKMKAKYFEHELKRYRLDGWLR